MKINPILQGYDRVALSYDEVAGLYQQIGEQLLQNLQGLVCLPTRILDIGCGTGYFTQALHRLFPNADIVGLDFSEKMITRSREKYPEITFLTADIFTNVFPDYSYDLIFCNAVMQDMQQPKQLFAAVKQLLAPKGVFLCSTFGPDTLIELKKTWALIDNHEHINSFIDMHDLGDCLRELAFVNPVLSMEKLIVSVPDVATLLSTVKAMGSLKQAPTYYSSQKQFQRLAELYPVIDDVVPVTCEIIYICAHQPESLFFAANTAQETHIPISTLLLNKR